MVAGTTRLNIDIFVKDDVNLNPAAQAHIVGIWRSLALRHRVRVWHPRAKGRSVLDVEPFEQVQVWTTPPGSRGFVGRAALAFIYEIALFARIIYGYGTRRPDLIYLRETTTIAPTLAAKLFRIPRILEVNGPLPDEIQWDILAYQRRILEAVLRWQARSAAKIIAVTHGLAKFTAERRGVAPGRIVVVANGADLDQFQPEPQAAAKQRLGLEAGTRLVCWIGATYSWHALDELFAAFRILRERDPASRLLLLVKDPDDELRRRIAHHGIEHQTVVASAVYEGVHDYINAADVCVAPFAGLEQVRASGLSPLKVYEYLACGRPVVASRLPGLEFIEERGLGFLFTPGAEAEFAAALEKALGLSQAEQEAMSRRCREYVSIHHSWPTQAGHLEDELLKLAPAKPSA